MPTLLLLRHHPIASLGRAPALLGSERVAVSATGNCRTLCASGPCAAGH